MIESLFIVQSSLSLSCSSLRAGRLEDGVREQAFSLLILDLAFLLVRQRSGRSALKARTAGEAGDRQEKRMC